jgi:hypothetical protein
MASSEVAFGDALRAAASSLRKTMTIEEELVTKSRKVSTGRLRERWLERETMKLTRTWRQAEGNESSPGRTGEYHQLHQCQSGLGERERQECILDIIANDGVGEEVQSSLRVGAERREVGLGRSQLSDLVVRLVRVSLVCSFLS